MSSNNNLENARRITQMYKNAQLAKNNNSPPPKKQRVTKTQLISNAKKYLRQLASQNSRLGVMNKHSNNKHVYIYDKSNRSNANRVTIETYPYILLNLNSSSVANAVNKVLYIAMMSTPIQGNLRGKKSQSYLLNITKRLANSLYNFTKAHSEAMEEGQHGWKNPNKPLSYNILTSKGYTEAENARHKSIGGGRGFHLYRPSSVKV